MESSTNNIKYQNYMEHILSFKMIKNNIDSLSWTIESPILNLHDQRQCILNVSCTYDSSSYKSCYFEFTISLKVLNNLCFKDTEEIIVSITINQLLQQFYLKEKVSSDELQCSQRLNISTCSSSVPLLFEIKVRDEISPVLIKDFSLLLDNEQYSDLTIDVQDKSFKVHKNIVFQRNEVLPTMLKHDMVEKQSNKITLTDDRNHNVVKEFLTFLYTGTCNITENSVELFRLAHYLQQSDLQIIIKEYMKCNINFDNFVVLFEIADFYELGDLYSKVKDFFLIQKNTCVKYPAFETYLRNSIKLSNIQFVLEIAHAYDMNETLKVAMEFVKKNYNEIVKTPKHRDFIQKDNKLLFKLFEYAVGYPTKELKD